MKLINRYRMKLKRFCCFVLVGAVLAGISGCRPAEAPRPSADPVEELAKSEIRDYEGIDLSSITDIRENAIKGTQRIDISMYRLKIDGLVENPLELTYDGILENAIVEKVVTLHCIDGWSADILWEGVRLKDLFDKVKVKSGANKVIFRAVDGYSTSLPLETVLDRDLIIAYKLNGVILPAELGYPFQLVAEDKLGYKWIKWLNRIELSDDPIFKGYWEAQGLNNDADVSK